jgi:hypothetical protein
VCVCVCVRVCVCVYIGPLLCAYLGACDAADWPQVDTHKRDREAEAGRGTCRGGGRGGGGGGGAAALEDAVYDRLVARNKRDVRFYAAARARARHLLQVPMCVRVRVL